MKLSARTADSCFLAALIVLGGGYLLFIAALLIADSGYTTPSEFSRALAKPEIQAAIWLTLGSSTISAILSMYVGIPLAYWLSRYRFRGKWLLEALLDVPLILPPLVMGLSLLILFHFPIGGSNLEQWLQRHLGFRVTYQVPAVILAQFTFCAALAARTMRVAFDELSPRTEAVALTLGANRFQAFLKVVLPEVWRGIVTAFTVAWARGIGEFGPILVFAGATRMRTEVLSTSVFLELSVGDLPAAVAVSLLMVLLSFIVLILIRLAGQRGDRGAA